MWWSSSSGKIELQLTKAQARGASHSGQCDADVRELSQHPTIERQLCRLDPDLVRAELREYGAWDAADLVDHAQNLQRLLWLAAGDIAEQARG